MTPAIKALEQEGVAFTLHPYEHSPGAEGYGDEAAARLGVEPDRMFKTLVVRVDGADLLLCLVPVSGRLDPRAVRDHLRAGKVEMADPRAAERATGFVVGGISPVGGRKRLPVLADETIDLHATVFVSAGRRGLQLELTPADLLRVTGGTTAAIAVDG